MLTAINLLDFNALLPSDWPRGHAQLHREIGWFVDETRLGVIVQDLVDYDYGFVLFTRNPVKTIDAATSYATVELATEAMRGSAAGEIAATDTRWDSPHNRSFEPVEVVARKIYNDFTFDDGPRDQKPAWVPHGNSDKQDEARALARAQLKEELERAIEAIGLGRTT